MPEKMIKQKINIRRLKFRVKRRQQRQRKIQSGDIKNIYSCPVYLCPSKHPTEESLIDHYNQKHADLVELGLKLRKSKKARQEEKMRKVREQASREERENNRIVIDDPKE